MPRVILKEPKVPLKPGKGKKNVSAIIRKLINEDKPKKQAAAIALEASRRKKKCCDSDKCNCASKMLQKSRLDFEKHKP